MSHRTARWLENTPTTSVQRLISLVRRSCGLIDQTWVWWATGKAVKARISGPMSASGSAAWGKRSSSIPQAARVLPVNLLRRRLLVDGPHHGRHSRLGAAGNLGEQNGHDVGTGLPASADRSDSPFHVTVWLNSSWPVIGSQSSNERPATMSPANVLVCSLASTTST